MQRRTLDLLVSWAGLVVVVVLVALGGLLVWGNTFVSGQVKDQLAAQKIFFPTQGQPRDPGTAIRSRCARYAGQQLLTGAQAETYADHFIAVHLSEVAGGKTYAQVSAASLADPNNATLKAEADTLFRGTTLRGLLLNAFAFSRVATIAGIAAVVSFVGAAVLFVFVVMGFAHARRVSRQVAPPIQMEDRTQQEAKAA